MTSSIAVLSLVGLLSCTSDVSRPFEDVAPGQPQWASIEPRAAETAPYSAELGRFVYEVRCAICHGQEGDGQGPAALYMSTPPRDFRTGMYKFRTSETGRQPTGDDLFRTITAGFPAYGMPSFSYLEESHRWAVAHYVESFSNRFDDPEERSSMSFSEQPRFSEERVAEGRAVFDKAQCGKCHGDDGRGFGPSAASLKDSSGNPIRTLDLASPAIYYKGGARAEDIMRTFSTGLNGTPMPSYRGAGISDDELWNLAYYVESLVGTRSEPSSTGAQEPSGG